MDLDDLDPRGGLPGAPKDLSKWNIEDLSEYIRVMEQEIDRAKAMIEVKKGVGSAADALFKK
ncbi:MAG: DUF1192 domain-containing protein [Rhodospirillaceae bacterium]